MFVADDIRAGRTRSALFAGSDNLWLGYGRFLETDPLGYEDGLNWYNYAGSDPINSTDPSGTLVMCTGSLIPQTSCSNIANLSCIGNCSSFWTPEERAAANIPEDINPKPKPSPNPQSSSLPLPDASAAASNPTYDPADCGQGCNATSSIQGGEIVIKYNSWIDMSNTAPRQVNDAIWNVGLPFLLGGAIGEGIAALPEISEALATSRTFGVASSRFGNGYYRGLAGLSGSGSWNYGPTRLGWSFFKEEGMLYFQARIGGYHVPTPIFTPEF